MPVQGRVSRLHRHMVGMLQLERVIERRMAEFMEGTIEHAEASALLEDLQLRARSRQQALVDRLASVASDEPVPDPVTMTSPIDAVQDPKAHPASSALVALHALFSQAVLGYAVLLELAVRAADSHVILGPENTGDLAIEGMRAYAAAAQDVARLLSFVVADELDQEGAECQCACPMCGLGVCGCALAFRRNLGIAWSDAGPIEMSPGIRMVRPRSGSAAAEAGLQRGDVIVGVDGRDLDSLPVLESLPLLQEAIRDHPSGTAVYFQVRRAAGETKELTLSRP